VATWPFESTLPPGGGIPQRIGSGPELGEADQEAEDA
jgi:hypothetical protein